MTKYTHVTSSTKTSEAKSKSKLLQLFFAFVFLFQYAYAQDDTTTSTTVPLPKVENPEAPTENQKPEWSTAQGYKFIEEPNEFDAPISMAFTHTNEGKRDDIKYFVTELRGKIFAVTNSGKKIFITEVDEVAKPNGELPYSDGEIGLNGICLSHDDKYLFTTAVIQSGFSIHNSVSRWEATNGDWTKIKKTAYLKDIFLSDRTVKSHNIGHCTTTADNLLIFGTGDGGTPERTHLIDSTNGKIFRTRFDFSGATNNPFYNSAKPKDPKSLFYAMGLRNPWAITFAQNEIFVADNGPAIDRVLRIQKGKDYPWSGTDISMTYDNLLNFIPAIGPSGIIFVPWNSKHEQFRGKLLVTGSFRKELLAVPLTPDFKVQGDWKAIATPVDQNPRNAFAGVFIHNDEIYLTLIRVRHRPEKGIIPSSIYKLTKSMETTGPVKLTGEALMHAKDCRACHVFIGRGGQQGPSLDDVVPRLKEQLSDKSYLKNLEKLNANKDEPNHEKWNALRDELINEKGSLDARVAKFIAAKIEHPQFNDATNVMPMLGLTPEEISEMVRYLTITSREPAAGLDWKQKLKQKLKSDPTPAAAVVLLLGIAIGFYIGRRRRKKI